MKSGYPQSFVAEIANSEASKKYPMGRNKWFLTEPTCGIEEEVNYIALSKCHFPIQFTCDSGHCIDIKKRCNEEKDCADGSDEKSCSLVAIPVSCS